MTYGHLRADCLYSGISSGPNAQNRVSESLYLYLLSVAMTFYDWEGNRRSGIALAVRYRLQCSNRLRTQET